MCGWWLGWERERSQALEIRASVSAGAGRTDSLFPSSSGPIPSRSQQPRAWTGWQRGHREGLQSWGQLIPQGARAKLVEDAQAWPLHRPLGLRLWGFKLASCVMCPLFTARRWVPRRETLSLFMCTQPLGKYRLKTSVEWQETSVKKICLGSQMGAYKENFRTEPFLKTIYSFWSHISAYKENFRTEPFLKTIYAFSIIQSI